MIFCFSCGFRHYNGTENGMPSQILTKSWRFFCGAPVLKGNPCLAQRVDAFDPEVPRRFPRDFLQGQ